MGLCSKIMKFILKFKLVMFFLIFFHVAAFGEKIKIKPFMRDIAADIFLPAGRVVK